MFERLQRSGTLLVVRDFRKMSDTGKANAAAHRLKNSRIDTIESQRFGFIKTCESAFDIYLRDV